MKTIVIGDIHGRNDWKRIIGQSFDQVIFIGDYLDTFDPITPLEQLNNLREIIAFKQSTPAHVILLVGNHDFHYWPGVTSYYSGYQPNMRASFEYEFNEFKSLFQIAHEQDDILFTHAGVTETWLRNNEIIKGDVSIVSQLNDLFTFTPNEYRFCGYDPYGDNITQGPLWVRPRSLIKDHVEGYRQVVGHTTMKQIEPRAYNEEKDKFWFVDTLNTSGEYLIIENGIFKIEKVWTETY